jgi:alginate production protein
MGQALDVVIGFRGLFDIRRFGLDLRTGLFFPGQAFRRSDGAATNDAPRGADKGASVVAKFRY